MRKVKAYLKRNGFKRVTRSGRKIWIRDQDTSIIEIVLRSLNSFDSLKADKILHYKKYYRNTKHNIEKYKKYKKIKFALHGRKRMLRMRDGGVLSIKTIQIVYEENIKKHRTLTCYLCLNPIKFGNDELEHKTPLCRGGKNTRENLDVSCFRCNRKKHSKTEKEYRKIIAG